MTCASVDIEVEFLRDTQQVSQAGIMIGGRLGIYEGKEAVYDCLKLLQQINNRRCVSIYAHNFSNFDSYFLLKALPDAEIEIDLVYLKHNSVIFVKAFDESKEYFFFDSFLFFSKPLNEIAKMFYTRKSFLEINKKTDLWVYLAFDVMYLYYFLGFNYQFFKQVYMAKFYKYITIAQLSYSLYMNLFAKKLFTLVPNELRFDLKRAYTTSRVVVTQSIGHNL